MKSLTLSLAAVALALLAAIPPASAHNPSAAAIPFADHGGVQDWRAQGDHTVYFEDQQRHWYRATLMGRAFNLPFAEHIGIDAGPIGTLDRFGAIEVGGQHYPFTSFERVSGPPVKTRGK
ncbi:DUF6491 family protein [Novosphingobium sp. Leaf2]|uniref:DUF6491 family protein n=1 Tax=Novosphingobium sp. Leaf2 TaxID=1735670 RepID=UPI0006FC65AC|nr:DUF6491 family protein [Novosphingobium sp. Leaf2]KQM22265.1 hypothetical protein ASE49_02970 [Novosphingobium sp. Leaf2]